MPLRNKGAEWNTYIRMRSKINPHYYYYSFIAYARGVNETKRKCRRTKTKTALSERMSGVCVVRCPQPVRSPIRRTFRLSPFTTHRLGDSDSIIPTTLMRQIDRRWTKKRISLKNQRTKRTKSEKKSHKKCSQCFFFNVHIYNMWLLSSHSSIGLCFSSAAAFTQATTDWPRPRRLHFVHYVLLCFFLLFICMAVRII